ncbi:hypothetical protein JHK85_005887 [Glycine max]|nr:hypothetical protein JHK85_005887 [Glycine max]
MRGMLLRGFKEKHVQVEQERELALKALQFFMDRDVHLGSDGGIRVGKEDSTRKEISSFSNATHLAK